MSTTDQEFKAREDYISYLETDLCSKAFRIGELEAALCALVIGINKGHIPVERMKKITAVMDKGKPTSYEAMQALREIYAA